MIRILLGSQTWRGDTFNANQGGGFMRVCAGCHAVETVGRHSRDALDSSAKALIGCSSHCHGLESQARHRKQLCSPVAIASKRSRSHFMHP